MRAALCLLTVLAACGDDTDPSNDPDATSELALPEGESQWTGTMEVGGRPFLADFELNLIGGDLTGTFTFRDDPEDPSGFGEGTFEIRGTHAPKGGLLAIAPYSWIDTPDVGSELLGFIGAYDGEELVGSIVDYATGDMNLLLGGPLRATKVSGDGAPVSDGDGANGLSVGEHAFSGTLRCSGPTRDVVGTFEVDDAGEVVGSMTLGDPGIDNPLGTFDFTGVHNATTGGITLVPGLWTEFNVSAKTFFIHGSYDVGTGAYEGDQLTDVDACPRETWSVVIE